MVMNDLKKKINDALSPFIGQPINDVTRKQMIPVIRKIMPNVLAQDIVGVQPMSSFFEPYKIVNPQNTDGTATIDANDQVAKYIWQQPTADWISAEYEQWPYERFYISQELLTLISLKWS